MRGFDFDKALVALQNELHCFAYKLTADKDEAENLLQETMLRTLDNKDKFPRIFFVRQLLINALRMMVYIQPLKFVPESNLSLLSEPEYHFLLRDDSFIFVDNGHDAKEIREALKTLPKAHYVVFMLYRSQISGNRRKDRSVTEYDKKPYLL